MLGARRGFGGKGRRGKEADRPFAPFAEQAGIALRQSLRHHSAESGGARDLLGEQARADVVAHLRIGQPLCGEGLAVGVLVEIPVRAAKGGYRLNFAVYQIVARPEAVVAREGRDDIAVDQLVQHLLETAPGDEGGHGQGRIFLANSIERARRRTAQFRTVDPLVTDDRDPVAPGDSAEHSGARHVGAGEGEGDQAEKGEGKAKADLGLEETAEESEHGCERHPVGSDGRPPGAERFGALYPRCDLAATGVEGFDPGLRVG